jgi:predicted nucleic acid-binding protein
MILVDSSVWIDYFRASFTPQTDMLDKLLAEKVVAVGDLMVVEVLQGTGSDLDFAAILQLLERVTSVTISDPEIAVIAARHCRILRAKGITVRKTIDTLIATRCIVDDIALLHSDRDFAPFAEHLGLRDAMGESIS